MAPKLRVLLADDHNVVRAGLRALVDAQEDREVVAEAADDLLHAIRTVARGGTFLDPSLTVKVLGVLARRPAQGGELSDREGEVLRLIARGFTNREIAARLDVSVKTVETHKARAMEKLGVDSRAGIVAYAIRAGWMEGG